MHRRQDARGERGSDEPPAIATDAELRPEQGLGGRGAEAHDDPRAYQRDLTFEPGTAGRDLTRVRLLVDAPLPARLPTEVLDHVGHVGLRAFDAGLLERPLQELAGGAHERPPGEVLLVPGLLADEHHRRVRSSFSEDGLGRPLPEVTRPTRRRFATQIGQGSRRDERRRSGLGGALPSSHRWAYRRARRRWRRAGSPSITRGDGSRPLRNVPGSAGPSAAGSGPSAAGSPRLAARRGRDGARAPAWAQTAGPGRRPPPSRERRLRSW